MDRALPWALGSGASSWRGRACSCPGLGGGGSLPHCRCTFDVARAVGQRKPELPSVAPLHQCHPVFNEAAEDVGLWARGPVAGLAGNQGAAFQPEMKGSLYPDSYQHTHTPFSPLWEGFSVWGAGRDSYSLFHFLTSLRRRTPTGVSVKREPGD